VKKINLSILLIFNAIFLPIGGWAVAWLHLNLCVNYKRYLKNASLTIWLRKQW